MSKFLPFYSTPATIDEIPSQYQQVRFIRDSLKSFSDVFKAEKDFLNKNVEAEMMKIFYDHRSSETGRPTESASILNETIDKILDINKRIDFIRRESFDQTRKLAENAKEKQSTIRQTISEHRDHFERAKKKLETADANRKKFDRPENGTKINFHEKLSELESECNQCTMTKNNSYDQYLTTVYRFTAEEFSISETFFLNYLKIQQEFYRQISQIFQEEIPRLNDKYKHYSRAPIFQRDLNEHCLERVRTPIAYPIEVTIHLLKDSIEEEGLFRQAPSILKQKKLVAQLDLQLIPRNATLDFVKSDPHVPANVLKQYLRELPDPLLTNRLFPSWNQLSTFNSDEQRLQMISMLIGYLPEVNFVNLRFLIEFLTRVAKAKEKNKMTPNNLGICIGSSLLTSKDNPNESTSTTSYTVAGIILETMINHFDQLFAKGFQHQQNFVENLPPTIPLNQQKPSTDLISFVRTSTRSNSSQSSEDLLQTSVSSQSTPAKHRKTRAAPQPPPLTRSHSIQNATNRPNNSKLSSNEKDDPSGLSQRSGSFGKDLDNVSMFDDKFHPNDSGLSRSSDNELLLSFDDSLLSNVSNEDKETKTKLSTNCDRPSPPSQQHHLTSEGQKRTSLRRNLPPTSPDEQSMADQYEVTKF